MTTEQFLTAASGWAISALFKYMPDLRERFERLNGLGKRILIALAVMIISLAVFALKCSGLQIHILEACTQAGVITLINIAFTVAANTQIAYLLLPNVAPKDAIPEPFPMIDDRLIHG